MQQTYTFDAFEENLKLNEIERLTKNVDIHSKTISDIFLSHGLIHSSKVLDVGCGTGAMLHLFANMLPQTEFIGIDSSQDILTSVQSEQMNNVTVLQAEATRLPFEDNTFDFVYTRLVLMHNQHPEHIIQEMKRVCKPKGIIVCVDVDDETMIFYPFDEEFSELIRANVRFAKNNGTDRVIGRKLFSLYKSAGINDVKVITDTSDFTGFYDEIPFPLRLAMGREQARHLVEAQLITEEQRMDFAEKVEIFCQDPNRFYTGSFIYCIGTK
ncbi:MAG TPA: methyltransferase domain-containing protein [Candidatus Paenibacillus intestinavium]|nr:methyltransferase domain-containing protein [Candidatus Paenibacillus intestinavium]